MAFNWDLNYPPPPHEIVILDTSLDSFNTTMDLPLLQNRVSDRFSNRGPNVMANFPTAPTEDNSGRNVRRTDQPNREIGSERASGARFTSLSNSRAPGGNDEATMEDDIEKKENQKSEVGESSQSVTEPREITFNCPICLGTMVEETTTKCGHVFCKECITSAIQKQGKCPTCRSKAKLKDTHRVYLPKAANN